MATSIGRFLRLVHQLPQVDQTDLDRYSTFAVRRLAFGFLWEPTRTVGLKQTRAEQLALVAERPETFEVQFTTGAFGWVVVHLTRIAPSELAELVFEAWRLTAPAELVEQQADRLPR